jgi:hypothetical protein
MSCTIKINAQGVISVFAENGKKSQLYKNINKQTFVESEMDALVYYQAALEFKNKGYLSDNNDEPILMFSSQSTQNQLALPNKTVYTSSYKEALKQDKENKGIEVGFVKLNNPTTIEDTKGSKEFFSKMRNTSLNSNNQVIGRSSSGVVVITDSSANNFKPITKVNTTAKDDSLASFVTNLVRGNQLRDEKLPVSVLTEEATISFQIFDMGQGKISVMAVEDNTRVGVLRLLKVGDKIVVKEVLINEDYKSKGIGRELYFTAFDELGQEIYSDEFQTPAAKTLWESLVSSGFAERLGPKTTTNTKKIEEVSKGVEAVRKIAAEYKKLNKIKGTAPLVVTALETTVSEEMAREYELVEDRPNNPEVKKSYAALIAETIAQYDFIVGKGLQVEKYLGKGEPYQDSKEMLEDLRTNNTLKFLPNDEAFGEGAEIYKDSIGLQPSGRFLADGYQLTNSEVFRIVHDYFGHGILGNQFGAIGEENATLQHLDLYSDEAKPAVVFQTRGQNSWVNFSGENKEVFSMFAEAKKLKNAGKEEEAKLLLNKAREAFKFAKPKEGIFKNKYNFKKYDTARRIREQEQIERANDARTNESNDLRNSLPAISKNNVTTRGINRRNRQGNTKIQSYVLKNVTEISLPVEVQEAIKKAFPKITTFPKIFEIKDGAVYRELKIKGLEGVPMSSSVTIHSAEKYNTMRMFVTEDGYTGITITKDGHLGGAFSSEKSGRSADLAQLMVIGVKEGATNAEAFDTFLPNYYTKFGFKGVSTVAFSEEIAKENDWNYEEYKGYNNGKPDIVHFIYDGGDRATIEERLDQFDTYSDYQKEEVKKFDKNSYDESYKYMEAEVVKRYNFEKEQNRKGYKLTSSPKEVSFQLGLDSETLQQEEITQSVIGRLEQAGLTSNIFQLSQEEILKKLEELGVESSVALQVVAWHGTTRGIRIIKNVTPVSGRYGYALEGTYYGDLTVARPFAGISRNGVPRYNSKLFKVNINTDGFVEIDYKGKTPTTAGALAEIIGWEKVEEIETLKREGKIRGLILNNTFEPYLGAFSTTQYVVYDNTTVEVIDKFNEKNVRQLFPPSFQNENITLTPKGFIVTENGQKNVYLNKDTMTLDTPLHEVAGHAMLDFAKQKARPIYDKGINLVNQELRKENSEIQDVIDYVKQTQPDLTGEALSNEILAEYIGRVGAELVNKQKKSKLEQWVSAFWDYVKSAIGIFDKEFNLENATIRDFAEAMNISTLRGDNVSEQAQYYFSRVADRLPLTLAVFNTKPFQDLIGKKVNPVTIQQLLNQTGIKQIEKDLINKVISENYLGQKKVDYNELEATVRANIMPLERIVTSTYATYGMNNLGRGNYGDANTLILNSPIEHGVTGHFSGDFKASGRKNIRYEAKQLSGNTWVAVEEGYQAQANNNNIYQFVGTAGTKEAVDTWIEAYKINMGTALKPGTKVNYADFDGDFKWGIVVKDLEDFVNITDNITNEEITIPKSKIYNGNSIVEKGVINKGMFGHIRTWQDDTTFYVAELQSDYFQKRYVVEDLTQQVINSDKYSFTEEQKEEYNSIFTYMVEYRDIYFKQKDYIKDRYKNNLLNVGKEELETLEVFKKSYEEEKAKYDKTVVPKARPLFSNQEKQFIASQKEWEKRMVREAIKEAALAGAETLRFPTPYTISVIEGYVSDAGNAPYETINANNSSQLTEGDTVEYAGEEYTVINADSTDITIAPSDSVYSENIEEYLDREIDYRTEETMNNELGFETQNAFYTLKEWDEIKEDTYFLFRDVDLEDIATERENGIYEINENEVEKIVREDYSREFNNVEVTLMEQGYQNIFTIGNYVYYTEYRAQTENFGQPDTYDASSKDDFSIESLSDTQQTVARKYEEIAAILKNERGEENLEVVTDGNGFDWYETKIEESESQKPVIAFQKTAEQKVFELIQSGEIEATCKL